MASGRKQHLNNVPSPGLTAYFPGDQWYAADAADLSGETTTYTTLNAFSKFSLKNWSVLKSTKARAKAQSNNR